MPRSTHLPPRSPIPGRGLLCTSFEGAPQAPQKNPPTPPSHTTLIEKPSWFDDLLSDAETGQGAMSLYRSSSDPVVLRDAVTSSHGPISPVYEEGALSDSLLYGPHSPRRKSKLLTDSESSDITALLKDVHSTESQYYLTDYPSTSAANQLPVSGDDCISASYGTFSIRHAGQRSRLILAHKIAELEKQAEELHRQGAQLAADVAAKCQERLDLYFEKKTLRKRIAVLKVERTVKDDQQRTLKKEVEILRRCHQRSAFRESTSDSRPQTNWQMQNLGNYARGLGLGPGLGRGGR